MKMKKVIKGDGQRVSISKKKHTCCKHFSDFCNRTIQLKSLTKLTVEKINDRVVFKKLNPSCLQQNMKSL